jgi:hypothetical protein
MEIKLTNKNLASRELTIGDMAVGCENSPAPITVLYVFGDLLEIAMRTTTGIYVISRLIAPTILSLREPDLVEAGTLSTRSPVGTPKGRVDRWAGVRIVKLTITILLWINAGVSIWGMFLFECFDCRTPFLRVWKRRRDLTGRVM